MDSENRFINYDDFGNDDVNFVSPGENNDDGFYSIPSVNIDGISLNESSANDDYDTSNFVSPDYNGQPSPQSAYDNPDFSFDSFVPIQTTSIGESYDSQTGGEYGQENGNDDVYSNYSFVGNDDYSQYNYGSSESSGESEEKNDYQESSEYESDYAKRVNDFESEYMTPMTQEEKDEFNSQIDARVEEKRKDRKLKLVRKPLVVGAVAAALGTGIIAGNVVTGIRDKQRDIYAEEKKTSADVMRTKSDGILMAYTDYVVNNMIDYKESVSYQGAQAMAERFEEQGYHVLSKNYDYQEAIQLFGEDPNLKLNVNAARDRYVDSVIALNDMCYDFNFYDITFMQSVFKDAVSFEGEENSIYIPYDALLNAGVITQDSGVTSRDVNGVAYVDYYSVNLGNKDAVQINL